MEFNDSSVTLATAKELEEAFGDKDIGGKFKSSSYSGGKLPHRTFLFRFPSPSCLA